MDLRKYKGIVYDAEIAHRKEVNSARKEGANNEKRSIAKAMLKSGESVSKVMNYTGLKKKEIKMLM